MAGRSFTVRADIPVARAYSMLVFVSIIWGGTFAAGRAVAGDLPPLISASLRFLLASLTLAGFLALTRRRLPLPSRGQWAGLTRLGFFGIFAYNLCFFIGLRYTEASRASLIIALNPALIAISARLLLHETLSLQKISGICLSLIGVGAVVFSRDDFDPNGGVGKGDVLILCCVACWVIYSVMSLDLSRALGSFATVAYSIWIGTGMLVIAALLTQPFFSILTTVSHMPGVQWLSLFYLGAIGSALAYILYYKGIRRVGASKAGAFLALNPITGLFLGWLFFDEAVTHLELAGGVAVVLGICAITYVRTGDIR